MIFTIHFLLCGYFCLEFLKDENISKMLSPFFKRFLSFGLIFYFLFIFFFLPKSFYTFGSLFFLIFLFWILKKQNHDALLFHLQNLLPLLSSQMKLGLSFMSSWQKSIEDVDQKEIYRQLLDITSVLQFEKRFQHAYLPVVNMVEDLIRIKKSAQPIKKLNLLEKKVKNEVAFYRSARQTLFQLRIQSIILSLLYFSLLIWTFAIYKTKYLHLMSLSFVFFSIGLFWIFKSGRKMKWSI